MKSLLQKSRKSWEVRFRKRLRSSQINVTMQGGSKKTIYLTGVSILVSFNSFSKLLSFPGLNVPAAKNLMKLTK